MPIDPLSGLSADQTRTISDAIRGHRPIDTLRMMAGTDVIDNCVFGSIVWERSLGRPVGPKLSEYFYIDLCGLTPDTDWTKEKTNYTMGRFPIKAKWDDNDDQSVYRVFFVDNRLSLPNHWIEAKFGPGTDWDVSTFRIVPELQNFEWASRPVWLKPFHIEPAIVVDPWKTAGRLTR